MHIDDWMCIQAQNEGNKEKREKQAVPNQCLTVRVGLTAGGMTVEQAEKNKGMKAITQRSEKQSKLDVLIFSPGSF